VDVSFKGNENSDDVAVQAWGMAGVNSYLIKRDTRKMGFAATKGGDQSDGQGNRCDDCID
jgi:hypothetical protein